MSRNYGLGQRDMKKAGQAALAMNVKSKAISFLTAATNGERWSLFVDWAKKHQIVKMEDITFDLVCQYGKELAMQVESGDLAEATAQNYVSAVNSIMAIATDHAWKCVSPTKDCKIKKRSSIRDAKPGALVDESYNQAKQAVSDQEGKIPAIIIDLARNLGLRSKEASLLNARIAADEAKEKGFVTIKDGTKGGRERKLNISSPIQIDILQRASDAQGNAKALIDPTQNWKMWREGVLRRTRELVKLKTGGGLHDLRSAFACDRYFQLTGQDAPCVGGKAVDRMTDLAARLIISAELGHGRIDITNEYLGGQS